MSYPFASLPGNLAAFCATLRREHRFLIGPGELRDAARVLELTAIADERAVRDALRPVLTASAADVQVFDHAFNRFFLRRGPGLPGAEAVALARDITRATLPSSAREAEGEPVGAVDSALDPAADIDAAATSPADSDDEDDEARSGVLRRSYSPLAGEGAMPRIGPVGAEWRDAALALASRVRAGSSRRWRPAPRGRRFDLRRTLRRSLPGGGELLVPRWRARRPRRARFVLLLDGSRSMSPYAAPALAAAIALTGVARGTETFTFSTALERVTPEIARAAAGATLRLRLHHAWGGGTAIGASLREFVHRFADGLLGRDTVVLVWSDGLDVGEPAILREAMASLARRSAAVVWLNPLLDTAGYEPSALGMSTARPFVSTLAAVQDPAALVRLSRMLRM